jgi:hypothetical protein
MLPQREWEDKKFLSPAAEKEPNASFPKNKTQKSAGVLE